MDIDRDIVSDIVLVPGLWLDGSTWDRVSPLLEQAGFTTHPVTLPGMRADDDRPSVALSDAVAAVVAAIDACSGQVVLVAHSAGCGIVHAAVDARPDRVARAVHIGGFPTPNGEPLADGFEAVGGEIPLPAWDQFDDADLGGLDDDLRRELRDRAIPAPARFTTDPQTLHDERRYAVPVTMVCPEYSADTLRSWVAAGAPPVQELTRIRDVTYVDLPTGHWPQFTRPTDLAEVILDAVAASRG